MHVKRKGGTGWRSVASGGGGCLPHAELDTDGRTAYVYTLDCDGGSAAVTRLDLRALLDGS